MYNNYMCSDSSNNISAFFYPVGVYYEEMHIMFSLLFFCFLNFSIL